MLLYQCMAQALWNCLYPTSFNAMCLMICATWFCGVSQFTLSYKTIWEELHRNTSSYVSLDTLLASSQPWCLNNKTFVAFMN